MIGLYFAASWCPACRSTTPLLASTYNALRHRGKGLQILLVSQDASESDFDIYRRAMPWPALPHGGAYPALLAEVFHVGAMPCLVLPCALDMPCIMPCMRVNITAGIVINIELVRYIGSFIKRTAL